jgi:hypothetical protein
MRGAKTRGRAGGLRQGFPENLIFGPQHFIIGPRFLTIEGGFSPKISPQSPISSLLVRQSTLIKQ